MAPRQQPHRSRQDYGTPVEFLAAVTRRFGRLGWDLAASATNSIVGPASRPQCYGPDSAFAEDSLAQSWANVCDGDRWCWLNPPFADIAPWAEKCALEMSRGARILLLTPASVGSHWYARHIVPNAHVLFLAPRLTFVGEAAPYPKDLMLSVFAHGLTGNAPWQWAPARVRRDGRAA